MSENHITVIEWERYLRGELGAADLLAVGDHVSACPGCRDLVADLEADRRGAREIRRELEASDHLTYEQMERFVDGGGNREERALVTGHTARCAACRHELGDLTAYARSRRTWGPAAWWASIAAVLVIASGLALTWMRQPAPVPASRPNVARNVPPAPAVQSPEQPQPPSSASSKLGPNAGKREVQLGASAEDLSAFRLLSPVGTRELDARPILRWSPAPGAKYYRVQVFDADFRLAASSPELSQTEWRLPHPLKPGKIYSWQVTAAQAGRILKAPQPPAPQALFEVAQSASAARPIQ